MAAHVHRLDAPCSYAAGSDRAMMVAGLSRLSPQASARQLCIPCLGQVVRPQYLAR